MPKSRSVLIAMFAMGGLGASLSAQAVDTVDVGGHGLEVTVRGNGAPVVVFESGLGANRTSWDALLPLAAEFTTAVAYTRAGYPGSGVGPEPRSPEQVNRELRQLLSALELPPPYVLVGHSLGALFSRAYYYNYPDEVAALVLIDGTHERQFNEWHALDPTWDPWDPESELAQGATQRPQGWRGEVEAWLALERVGILPNSRPLDDLPVYMITAVEGNPSDTTVIGTDAGRKVWRSLHAELFADVRHGAHLVTSRSGHRVHGSEPSLVLWAIKSAVDAVRSASGGR